MPKEEWGGRRHFPQVSENICFFIFFFGTSNFTGLLGPRFSQKKTRTRFLSVSDICVFMLLYCFWKFKYLISGGFSFFQLEHSQIFENSCLIKYACFSSENSTWATQRQFLSLTLCNSRVSQSSMLLSVLYSYIHRNSLNMPLLWGEPSTEP